MTNPSVNSTSPYRDLEEPLWIFDGQSHPQRLEVISRTIVRFEQSSQITFPDGAIVLYAPDEKQALSRKACFDQEQAIATLARLGCAGSLRACLSLTWLAILKKVAFLHNTKGAAA